jgi:hypothetical protein
MSFQSNRTYLESAFDVLKQQSASTFESWDDPVQRRFYEQFINSLPKEVHAYLIELSKIDKSFEKAEQQISILQQ